MDKEPSEIEKLTERISRDPKSKLFVSLAEEYKKTGDIDMAIHVLNEGLKNNQGYLTARSFLGKLLIEKGDLPSAQQEFEEVVRAIPDNLMAQRRLADLYALQDRAADALVHYKIALSLNPNDAETATLLAEAEAGRDIKRLLRGGKGEAPEQQQKKAEAKVPVAAAPAPLPEPPGSLPEKESELSPPSTQTSSLFEEEEPEEVLVVEPLDAVEAEAPSDAAEKNVVDLVSNAPESLDFLSESAPEPSPSAGAIGEREQAEESASLAEPFAAVSDLERGQTPEEETLVPIFLEDAPAETEAEQLAQELAVEPGEEVVEAEKQADDFTTDTLAELYISQGFFEKAVDIYERMLVDNPDSQGLKNKLAKVRTMAATSPAAETETITGPVGAVEEYDLGDQVRANLPSKQEPLEAEFIPAEEQYAPPMSEAPQIKIDEWELPSANEVSVLEEAGEQKEQPVSPQQFDVGFEPREYLSPDAIPAVERAGKGIEQTGSGAGGEEAVEQPISARDLTSAGKQRTVDRLEKWLKNLRKEN